MLAVGSQGLYEWLVTDHDFNLLAHKKEFIVWYAEAKKDDTRARRLGWGSH